MNVFLRIDYIIESIYKDSYIEGIIATTYNRTYLIINVESRSYKIKTAILNNYKAYYSI
jgi:hypothetical protein